MFQMDTKESGNINYINKDERERQQKRYSYDNIKQIHVSFCLLKPIIYSLLLLLLRINSSNNDAKKKDSLIKMVYRNAAIREIMSYTVLPGVFMQI